MSLKAFKYNYIETIIIVLAFILNPFVSLILTILFVVYKNNNYLNFLLIINASLFISLLNTTKVPESDLLSYHDFYLDSEKYTLLDYLSIYNREFLFYFSSYVISSITEGSWKLFIFFTTFISYFLILKSNFLIYKIFNPKSTKFYLAILSVAFFYILFSHSAHLLRNFIAASFVIYFLVNYYFLGKNKWWFLISAVLIHSTAGLFAITYLLPKTLEKNTLKKWFNIALVLLVTFTYLNFNDTFLKSNYQINRLNEIYNQVNIFNISEIIYGIVFLFSSFLVYFILKKENKYHASYLFNYIILMVVLVVISALTLSNSVLISQRILLFIFILSTVFVTLLIISKSNISQIITPVLITTLIVTFIYNYKYGMWEYSSFSKILSNSLFSFFY